MMSTGQAVIRVCERLGDLGWVAMAHGEQYAREFGWSTEFEQLVIRILADFTRVEARALDRGWIAELDGHRVGCVFCVADDAPDVARLRLLLVDPATRGHHLGRRLLDTAVTHARDAGCRRVRLWTNDPLRAARRIYLDSGFVLTAEEQHHSFGVSLTGQTYELDL